METVQVRITKPMYKILCETAERRSMAKSALLDKILRQYFREQTEKK